MHWLSTLSQKLLSLLVVQTTNTTSLLSLSTMLIIDNRSLSILSTASSLLCHIWLPKAVCHHLPIQGLNLFFKSFKKRLLTLRLSLFCSSSLYFLPRSVLLLLYSFKNILVHLLILFLSLFFFFCSSPIVTFFLLCFQQW